MNGVYLAGEKMPSIREVAETLCVSRNTVERAYGQLLVEGYVGCRQRSGYYVEDFDVEAVASSLKSPTLWGGDLSDDEEYAEAPDDAIRYDFCYYNPAPEAFPYNTWRKLTTELLYTSEIRENNRYGNPFGDTGLRSEIARFAFESRGVACRPGQVIILSGFAEGLDRVLKLFSPDEHAVAFENPCLHVVHAVVRNDRFPARPLDVSSPERFLDDLARSRAKLVYVTPSHQFPTGSTMSLTTRLALLEWAAANDAYIVEDDYDSEFRYRTKATPSLHALDSEDRVIYAGSFSKVLSPSLRMGYWILPPQLVERYRACFGVLPSSVPWLNQRALCQFFAQNHMRQHLRKYLTLNRKKREALLDACQEVFGGDLELAGVDAGLHMWAHLKGCDDAEGLVRAAREAQVAVYSPRDFYYDPSCADPGAFMIGHSRIAEEDILPGVRRLREAWSR